jgi:hypothetical protein
LWVNKIAIFLPRPSFVLRPLSAGDGRSVTIQQNVLEYLKRKIKLVNLRASIIVYRDCQGSPHFLIEAAADPHVPNKWPNSPPPPDPYRNGLVETKDKSQM